MKYTQEEVHMAIGSIIEYTIPAQVWLNYTKPAVQSQGKLTGAPPIQYDSDRRLMDNGIITVYDTKYHGEITAPYSGIIKLPFIDVIRETKLYKMVKNGNI